MKLLVRIIKYYNFKKNKIILSFSAPWFPGNGDKLLRFGYYRVLPFEFLHPPNVLALVESGPKGHPKAASCRRRLIFKYFYWQIHGFEFFLRSRIFLGAFFRIPVCSRDSLIFFIFLGFFYIFLRPARTWNMPKT